MTMINVENGNFYYLDLIITYCIDVSNYQNKPHKDVQKFYLIKKGRDFILFLLLNQTSVFVQPPCARWWNSWVKKEYDTRSKPLWNVGGSSRNITHLLSVPVVHLHVLKRNDQIFRV
jgi:hypothetical protein